MDYNHKLNITLCLVLFALGLLFVITNKPKHLIESFITNRRCPDILLQHGSDIFLFNSKQARIPGRNPIRFNNLNEYVQYLGWERSQGKRCPPLFLQHTYDTQGNETLVQRPSPFNLEGGNLQIPIVRNEEMRSLLINATRNNPPFNENLFPGFDPKNQYQGLITPLDKMFNSDKLVSANPMDTNWGGTEFTKTLVDDGYYADNEVGRPRH